LARPRGAPSGPMGVAGVTGNRAFPATVPDRRKDARVPRDVVAVDNLDGPEFKEGVDLLGDGVVSLRGVGAGHGVAVVAWRREIGSQGVVER